MLENMVQKYEIIWNLPNFAVTLFNFPSANLLRLGKKRNEFLLFCSRLFVTLQEFSAFLYIKAVREIEDFLGYG